MPDGEDQIVERLCEVMHDAYEAAATEQGWETQQASRKPWSEVPEANKATMRAAVTVLRDQIVGQVIEEFLKEMRWQEEQRLRTKHLDTRLTHRYTGERMAVVARCVAVLFGHGIERLPRR